MRPELAIREVSVAGVFTVPTETAEESDGTRSWSATTAVVVRAVADDGTAGIGWTYAGEAAGAVVRDHLADVVRGGDALAPAIAWERMHAAIRQLGHGGIAPMALSAVDVALWDLKARLLELPLARLLPRVREAAPAYGSGGFTNLSERELRAQVDGWLAEGFARMKVKVGRDPEADPRRLAVVRDAAGEAVELMVDGNGAYRVPDALRWAHRFAAEQDARWFEEPVSSQDVEGLRRVRAAAPPGMAIAAGEYAWDPPDVARLRDAGAVDVVQADVSRCGGITGLLRVDGLCAAVELPFSAHCVPSVMAHLGCAMTSLVHCEHFYDHARVERQLFDGAPVPRAGALHPRRDAPGLGLELRAEEAIA